MSEIYREKIKLKQMITNLEKAEDLVKTFPDHPSIRLAIPDVGEIPISLARLSYEEKVLKIYNTYNNYLKL